VAKLVYKVAKLVYKAAKLRQKDGKLTAKVCTVRNFFFLHIKKNSICTAKIAII